ncbi:MAG: hypothetical protein EOO61_03760 [Hymenobacter sp.]|nr:MAG: hypothetical protein EOO61_03760 [Hymenobacter sp.]
MSQERLYTSRRFSILKALTDKLIQIDGTGDYRSNVYKNVHPKLVFWDEVEEYPGIFLNLGPEYRVNQGGGYKDRFLSVTIRCYVRDEEPQNALELLLEDIETVIEQNGRLAYQDSSGATQFTQDILVVSIDTDEGTLAPLGVGEMTLQVRY